MNISDLKILLRSSLLSLALICIVMLQGLSAQSQKFDPQLLRVMEQTNKPVPVIVVMNAVQATSRGLWDEPTAAEIEYQRKQRTVEVQWQLRQFVNEWVGVADYSGNPAISNYLFMWTNNSMVATVSQDVIWQIAEMPAVAKLLLDRNIHLTSELEDEAFDIGSRPFTYGLERIRVPELRDRYPDILGDNVLVGVLDTGIDANHPDLKSKVVAWRDFIGTSETPYDGHGHGTHVAGTIAGGQASGTAIGVAPNAKLIIGKILSDRGSGSLSGILRGMEWVANPERKLDTRMRPRVVNNSWGASMEADLNRNPFAQAVMSWVELDIFPVFAAGNSGPSANTIGTPANLPMSYAVGATDSDNKVTRFSSRGPVRVIERDGKQRTMVKPDISAPGHQIVSSMPGSRYARMSGTSMAAPHLAGVAALVYQMNPHVKIQDMINILTNTADRLGFDERNNDYGEGLVNAYKAVETVYYESF